jgi:hypothetical protein
MCPDNQNFCLLYRHGARTPLTDDAYLWQGQEWNVCGKAFEASIFEFLLAAVRSVRSHL